MFKARNLHETFLQSLGAARKSGNSACHKRKTTFLWQRQAQRGSMERRSEMALAPHRSLGPLIGAALCAKSNPASAPAHRHSHRRAGALI